MPTLIPKIVGFALLFTTCGNALGQVLFFDNFEQFGNGTDLTSTNYTPASGPSSASVATSVQNGSPTIKATNFLGSTWALFDNSVVTNKDSYEGLLSWIQTNQPLQITWKMWIQATNSGPGMYLLSLPVQDANPSVTYNPPVVFMDTGSIVALTNGTSVQIPIGNWGSLAGTVMTNTLILDYPNGNFSYSLNGQLLATLPLGPYFTNVVGAIYFTGFERPAGSLGDRFAIDDVKVELATSAQAQINGCDDFSDNFKYPTRWGPVFTQGCCGLLTETNGRLEFTKSSGGSSALASQPWILNFGSYAQN